MNTTSLSNALTLLLLICTWHSTRAEDVLQVSTKFKVRTKLDAFDDVIPAKLRQQIVKSESNQGTRITGFAVYNIGTIPVRSGKLAAFDGATFAGGALKQSVANGDYPVLLFVSQRTRSPDSNGETDPPWDFVHLSRVLLSDRPAVRWELAGFVDEAHNKPKDSLQGQSGYPVDSGLGAYADAKDFDRLRKVFTIDMNHKTIKHVSAYHGLQTPRSWARIKVNDTAFVRWGNHHGDGSYPSYWGYDKDGKIVSLVTDFMPTFVSQKWIAAR